MAVLAKEFSSTEAEQPVVVIETDAQYELQSLLGIRDIYRTFSRRNIIIQSSNGATVAVYKN